MITYLGHFEEREAQDVKELTLINYRKYLNTNGNKYVYFDVNIDNKYLKRIVIELFYTKCPKTCDNFLALCVGNENELKEKLTYEDTTINRIVKGSYIQGGDLSKTNSISKPIIK